MKTETKSMTINTNIKIFVGPAGTGKTTKARRFAAEHGGAIDFSPEELKGRFFGQRLTVVPACILLDDVIDVKKLPWARLKALTGGDPLTIERKYRTAVEIQGRYCVAIATNQPIEKVADFIGSRPDLESRVELIVNQ
jgi:hypothetical protein